jgi:hypothetical protein
MFVIAPNAEGQIFRLLSIFRLLNSVLLYPRPDLFYEYPLMRQYFSARCEVKEGGLSEVEGFGSQYEVKVKKRKTIPVTDREGP